MEYTLGMVQFMLAAADPVQLLWCGGVLAVVGVLLILHHAWHYDDGRLGLWQKLCLMPFLLTTVHYGIYTVGAPDFMHSYTPLYLIAVLMFVPLLCGRLERGYRRITPVVFVLMLLFGVHFCLSPTYLGNFSRKSYTASFHALVQEMEAHYVLGEWKELDFAALEQTYMPLVREAEAQEDPVLFADAVTMFCHALHDGHVQVYADYSAGGRPSAYELHDYGLAMIGLDSGEVIAVCTREEVHSLGITDGTVITAWNGKEVHRAAAEDVPDTGEPVLANAQRLSYILLSATGTDTATVTWLDDRGQAHTSVLPALDEGHTYGDARNALLHDPGDLRTLMRSDFSAFMLDDKCGCLILSAETSGSIFRDYYGAFTGESHWAREMLRRKLRRLRAQGMEYLVIDLRCNAGGYGEIGYALCSLLSREDGYANSPGIRTGGAYRPLCDTPIPADGEFADLRVAALTNCACISAGDSTALCLSRLDNVTLCGITDPNGSAQMTGGVCVLSDGLVSVCYPTSLVLNEDGQPDIDPRADRISRNPVEERIPLDREAAMQIFRDGTDYELAWAVSYLETDGCAGEDG